VIERRFSTMKQTRVLMPILAVVALALFGLVPAAVAAPPANDDFANATAIDLGAPFTDASDLTEATIEPGEPTPSPWSTERSVWYAFTPATDAVVNVGQPIVRRTRASRLCSAS
jgi:hypothetical protein